MRHIVPTLAVVLHALCATSALAQQSESADGPKGTRLMLQVQSNTPIGQLMSETGGAFDFERATLAGVPDAFVGLRFDRLTLGLGFTWLQVNTPQVDPCDMDDSLDDTATLFGFIPSARFDVLTTSDGRGRFEAGVALPLLASSRSREQPDPGCGGGEPESRDRTDGVYGLDLLFGGRYHIWPALSIGAEMGLSYMVFDFDNDPATDRDPASITTLTVYSGLTLVLEVPL